MIPVPLEQIGPCSVGEIISANGLDWMVMFIKRELGGQKIEEMGETAYLVPLP